MAESRGVMGAWGRVDSCRVDRLGARRVGWARVGAHGLHPTWVCMGFGSSDTHPWLSRLTSWLVQVMDQWVHHLG
jgi:hypothetical protein